MEQVIATPWWDNDRYYAIVPEEIERGPGGYWGHWQWVWLDAEALEIYISSIEHEFNITIWIENLECTTINGVDYYKAIDNWIDNPEKSYGNT